MNRWVFLCVRFFVYNFVSLPFSVLYAYMRFCKKNRLFVFMPCDGIGDTIFALGFLDGYKKQNRITSCCIIGCRQKKTVYEWYKSSFDEYIEIPHWILRKIYEASKTDLGSEIFITNKNNFFLAMPQGYYRGGDQQYYMLDDFTQIDAYRSCLYRLEKSAVLKKPVFPKEKIDNIIKKYSLIEGKTIIIAPDANTIKGKRSFFEILAKELLNQGYLVLTNLVNEHDEPIKDTQGIYLPLDIVCSIADYCGAFIGMRSGLLDVVMFSKSIVIALYPKDDMRFKYFNINYFENKNMMQYLLTDNFYDDAKKIIQAMIQMREDVTHETKRR